MDPDFEDLLEAAFLQGRIDGSAAAIGRKRPVDSDLRERLLSVKADTHVTAETFPRIYFKFRG